MLIEMFLLGSFWFWALLLIATVAVTILSNTDYPALALVCVVVTFALLQFCGNADPVGYLWHHPLILGMIAIPYVPLAVSWSFFKWRVYVEEKDHEYKLFRAQFLRDNNVTDTSRIPDELLEKWGSKVIGRYNGIANVKPLAIEHKSMIVQWMAFFPFSVAWWLCNDFFREIFNHIYYRLNAWYQAVVDNIFAGVEDDFRKPSSN